MSVENQVVHKVSLKSGKVVMLRDPLISDMEHATSIAGKGNFDNQALLGTKVQKEMLKLLIVSIDKLFTLKEYNQLCAVVKNLCMEDAEGNESTEIAFGDSSSK